MLIINLNVVGENNTGRASFSSYLPIIDSAPSYLLFCSVSFAAHARVEMTINIKAVFLTVNSIITKKVYSLIT